MSGYAGDLFVRVRPETTGFAPALSEQMRGAGGAAGAINQTTRAQAGLVRETDRYAASSRRAQAETSRHTHLLEGLSTKSALAGLNIKSIGSAATVGAAGFVGFTAASLGVEALADTFHDAVAGAAQLQKQGEGLQFTFGPAAKEVKDFAEGAATDLGISGLTAEKTAVRFGILLHNLHIGKAEAADMSVNLERLAGAIAAIRGVDPATVLQRLPLVLAGNLRSLKELGFALSQQQIKQEAVRQGLLKSTGTLTPAIKAQAIYNLVIRELPGFEDQAAQHAGDLVNQQRKLTAEWSNAKDELGKGLLPVVTEVTTFFADNLPGAMHEVEAVFHDVKSVTDPLIGSTVGYKHAIEALLLLKVAQVVSGWAAAETAAAGATVVATGATEAETIAVIENTAAVEQNTIVWGARGEVLATVATESAAVNGGLAANAVAVGALGAKSETAVSKLNLLKTGLLTIGRRLFVATLELEVVSALTGHRIDPIHWAYQAGQDTAKAFFSGLHSLGVPSLEVAAPQPTGLNIPGLQTPARTTKAATALSRYLGSQVDTFRQLANGDIQVLGPDGTVFRTYKKSGNPLLYQQALARARLGIEQQRQAAKIFREEQAYAKSAPPVRPPSPLTGLSNLQPYQQLQVEAIKAQASPGLQDDLRVAQAIESIFDRRVRTTRLTGAKLKELLTEQAQAHNAVAQIQQQIDQEAKQNAQRRASEAKQAAAERKRLAQQEIQARQEALQTDLQVTEQILQNQVAAAGLTEKRLSDDRKAMQALLRFYQRESRDLRLTRLQRLQFAGQAIAERQSILDLGKDTTKGGTDGGSINDFFRAAVDQFNTYRSTLAPFSGGVLSSQAALADYSGRALGRIPMPTGQTDPTLGQIILNGKGQLDESKKQTVLLAAIAGAVTGKSPIAKGQKRPPNAGIKGARAATALLTGAVSGATFGLGDD